MKFSRLFYIAGAFCAGTFSMWTVPAPAFVIGGMLLLIATILDYNDV